ncbi:MAG TPA: ABC transporter permease [Gemmatimonadales bacterium]|jgi:ABC-2 type transport system permease protein|nr:ABC transporter permease [Gemmatimonadales bacterium]
MRERIREWTLWPMLWKEFVQLRRDRFTLAMMVALPAVQLLLFGFAIQTEVRHIRTLVLDESKTPESRALVRVMTNTGNFDFVGTVASRAEIADRIGRGEAGAALVIPPAFMADLRRGRTAEAQVIVDAADPMSSSAAMSGAAQAAQARALELADPRGAAHPPLEVRIRPWYNPGLRSAVYIVPGIVGVLLSMTMVMITSMAVVRERERGTLEQLVVTPISRTGLMLGKLIPFLLIGYVQMTVVLLLGRLVFDVPFRGSLVALYVITLAFIVANLGLGLLLSTAVRTQTQAMQLSFFFLMPNILLSGFMFPREAMPAPAQWLGALLPLTYYLRILRAILLKGVGTAQVWPESLALVGFALVLVALSVRRFSKTIE